MACIDEQSYEEVMQQLRVYVQRVEEECNVLLAAADDCVDNTDEDPVAAKASLGVRKCVTEIGSAVESIDKIIDALGQELDDARATAAKAQSIDI